MAEVNKYEIANRKIRSITNVGLVTNIALSMVKVVVGILGSSMALVADGVHSISDMVTDVTVLVGVYFGSKEADPRHPYGHGRIETFASVGVALVLVLVGLGMAYQAGKYITEAHKTRPGVAVLCVAVISIISKEALYRATRKVAVATHSTALYANAWHHRSDALSSVAVVIGVASAMLGFTYGDHIAAMAVGLMIALVGVRIILDCLNELTESAVDEGTTDSIKQIVNSNDQIRQWHKLRTRMVGREVFLDLHILVAPELNVAAAHEIAENLEKAIHEQITHPVNIIVHVEPDLPALRK
ncbi:MAG TPA: cation diffusion facilitator family transporter [Sedimentisphaerales bacterium]|nr:cation diffusion facilitator family transporter [Sedimentisphaerales bacterium]